LLSRRLFWEFLIETHAQLDPMLSSTPCSARIHAQRLNSETIQFTCLMIASNQRRWGLLPARCALTCVGIWGVGIAPALAQTPIELTNTASGNFRLTPGSPPTRARSNTTVVPALIIAPPQLEIVKSGDRVVAEPGDTVIYRLVIRNTSTTPAGNVVIQDTLPIGFRYVPKTTKASLAVNNAPTEIPLAEPTINGRILTFNFGQSLAQNQVLTLNYGVLLTQDALRGSGRNLAVAGGIDPIRQTAFQSNTASYQLQLRPGILSDCGTILGRVFVDKNFDGEAQAGEPGIPNAVIYMDDGNRITTDANGLFSLLYVLPGSRVGTLDIQSLAGYTIAPNLYRKEGNSPSRMVQIAPGTTRRMNFAVTPNFGEGRGEVQK
jgi:uncharacterized repeat protein (TIGR01451 family)